MTIDKLIDQMTQDQLRDALHRVWALPFSDPQHGDLAIAVDEDGNETAHYWFDPTTMTARKPGWYSFDAGEPSSPTAAEEFALYPCQWNIGAAIKEAAR